MKKILLTLCIFASAICANAQKEVVFNELVPDPGNSSNEYFELYNTTGGEINIDCWTMVTYDFAGSGGVWVYNLPKVTITPFGFAAFASAKPFNYKCGTFDSTNVYNWNDVTNLTQSLTHYNRSGNNLIGPLPGVTNDLITIKGGPTASLAVMLFDGTGALVNAFFTNNGTTIPAEILSLSNLIVPIVGDLTSNCAATAELKFSEITAPTAEVLSVQAAVGNDNNYFRTRDGICGAWIKGQSCFQQDPSKSEFTPGKKNGNLPPIPVDPNAITFTALRSVFAFPEKARPEQQPPALSSAPLIPLLPLTRDTCHVKT